LEIFWFAAPTQCYRNDVVELEEFPAPTLLTFATISLKDEAAHIFWYRVSAVMRSVPFQSHRGPGLFDSLPILPLIFEDDSAYIVRAVLAVIPKELVIPPPELSIP
jgi:hypothetical protein